MTRWTCALLCCLATAWLYGATARADSSTASGSAPSPAPRCPDGYECYPKNSVVVFTPQQAASVDRAMIALERDLAVAQARGRRWGCVAGGGLGLAMVVDREFDAQVAPAG